MEVPVNVPYWILVPLCLLAIVGALSLVYIGEIVKHLIDRWF